MAPVEVPIGNLETGSTSAVTFVSLEVPKGVPPLNSHLELVLVPTVVPTGSTVLVSHPETIKVMAVVSSGTQFSDRSFQSGRHCTRSSAPSSTYYLDKAPKPAKKMGPAKSKLQPGILVPLGLPSKAKKNKNKKEYLTSLPTFESLSEGRIWLLWNNSLVEVELISFSDQYLHCQIIPTNCSISPYYITSVYASNSSSERLILWQDLKSIAVTINSQNWIVGGDFNEVRYASKKMGGRPPHSRRLNRFNNCISDCYLEDLRSPSSPFSWRNKQEARIACKLDRVLVNSSWMLTHTDSFYQSLALGLLDHIALQVFVTPDIPSGPRPFKYMQAWESHSDFEHVEQPITPFGK
ncbi:hypothetical protein QJS04_geneDACA023305 [Acorus gramineus]|uniref:Endonuclease/exonuclease/phosphatase domain-containing protein n=1 Tax=Acorus gramineus TaxID=55184 RepID=A0AAV9B9Y2_ACOGR|nr:hypothetical protein QJS04_geneDACA023305 [Acorus gramineus]